MKLWDLCGNCLATFHGHTGTVNSAAFNPAGNRIVTASDDKTAKLWNLRGRCLATLQGHTKALLSAAFNPTGNRILTTSADRTAKLWNRNATCLVTLQGHTDSVCSAAFNSTGMHILTSSLDSSTKLWHLHRATFLQKLFGYSTTGIYLGTFQRYERREMLSQFFNNGDIFEKQKYRGGASAIFNSANHRILITFFDKTAKCFTTDGTLCLSTLEGHDDFILSAAFNPVEDRILTASADGTAKIWDLYGNCLTTLIGHAENKEYHIDPEEDKEDKIYYDVNSAVFNPAGDRIVTASDDCTAKLWNLDGTCLATLQGHTSYVCSAVFNSTGDYIVTTSWDGTAKLWNLLGNCLVTFFDSSVEKLPLT